MILVFPYVYKDLGLVILGNVGKIVLISAVTFASQGESQAFFAVISNNI